MLEGHRAEKRRGFGKDETHLFFPSYLGLEIGLAVDVDNFKFLYEDREPEEGPSNGTRWASGALTEMLHISWNFSVVAFKTRPPLKDLESVHPPCSSSIHCGFFEVLV